MSFGYKTKSGITVLPELEAVRARPAMYLGEEDEEHSFAARLLEDVVNGLAFVRRGETRTSRSSGCAAPSGRHFRS